MRIECVTGLHKKTKRNYVERVVEHDKAECAVIAKQFGKDYWDGDRKYGYGGYYYDGRWKMVAEKIVERYKLSSKQKVLDVGCGKGFLLYELMSLVDELEVMGVDTSDYALENAKQEVKPYLINGLAQELPFKDKSFDFVYSITTLHNLYIYDLKKAVQEIERVSKGKSFIMVESYRNEREKANLLYWQLTCECFFKPDEWEWLFKEWGYTGDWEFIYFE